MNKHEILKLFRNREKFTLQVHNRLPRNSGVIHVKSKKNSASKKFLMIHFKGKLLQNRRAAYLDKQSENWHDTKVE